MGSKQKLWELGNGEVLHASFPQTFGLPDLAEREGLQPGYQVKCIFKLAPGRVSRSHNSEMFARYKDAKNERMWVTVVSRKPGGGYIGALDNEPVVIPDLEIGDRIDFGPEHVIDIIRLE